ncbi:hypothetical protein MMC17_007737 [Xylographa soralifera]|nr:hypothetical protein [Xylographa soralifera]
MSRIRKYLRLGRPSARKIPINLLNLPFEILASILEPFLISTEPIVVHTNDGPLAVDHDYQEAAQESGSTDPFFDDHVLRVCSTFHSVGTEVLYRSNRFHISGLNAFDKFMRTIGPLNASYITKLRLWEYSSRLLVYIDSGALTTRCCDLTRVEFFFPRQKEALRRALRKESNRRCKIKLVSLKDDSYLADLHDAAWRSHCDDWRSIDL